MSSIAYLPNVSAKDNNTRQIRRRANDMVSQVSQQVGSIASGVGDLGTLHDMVQQRATSESPVFTGTVAQPAPPVLTKAHTSTGASAGAAAALPTAPLGYLTQVINGQTVKLPYYAV